MNLLFLCILFVYSILLCFNKFLMFSLNFVCLLKLCFVECPMFDML